MPETEEPEPQVKMEGAEGAEGFPPPPDIPEVEFPDEAFHMVTQVGFCPLGNLDS